MKLFDLGMQGELSREVIRFLEEEEAENGNVERAVREILAGVKADGFEALKRYTTQLDHFSLTAENFRVGKEEIDTLAKKITPELSECLEIAVERVKAFHEKQLETGFEMSDAWGNRMGQRVIPLDSVAVYVPGGRALYPSTFYMTVIPALIAGVRRIVVLTPPRTFVESPEIARLIQLLGITEVYRGCGTALVLSAACGIDGLVKVDKIVGPGNAYIAKAKQICYGKIDIDMIAGPSDITVIADTRDKCDVKAVAADLLSQAEHDPMARSILIAVDREFALKVKEEVFRQAGELTLTKENALASLEHRAMILLVKDRMTAVEVANQIAPEHLELFSEDPDPLLERVRFAGSVFVGKSTPESVGDYLGGPNHVLPTSATARFFSPLGVYDFVTRFSFLEFQQDSLEKYRDDITRIARSEKLEAHAKAVESRFLYDAGE